MSGIFQRVGWSGAPPYLLVLLEQVVQVVAPLVVEVEVLALGLALGAHHLVDGRPVPPVLHQP